MLQQPEAYTVQDLSNFSQDRPARRAVTEFQREVQRPRLDMVSGCLFRPEGVLPCHAIGTCQAMKEPRSAF
jgi:hypothetical protein